MAEALKNNKRSRSRRLSTGNHSGKSGRPILRKAVSRERLFKRLDRLLDGPVIWVPAQAGAGKLLWSVPIGRSGVSPAFGTRSKRPIKTWPPSFIIWGPLSMAFPKRKKTLPLLTPEYLQGIPTFSRRFFKEAFGGLKSGTAFVLDNFQFIPENSRVQEVILSGVNEIPPDKRLVLISRGAPPPAWIRLRANQRLGLLTWEDLRLTLEETVEIARLRADRDLPRKTLKSLHAVANGWAAGVMLMLESLRRGIDIQAAEETHREGILQYFGLEIFSKTDSETQDFLLKTALLPRMTVKLVETLTGLPEAGARLAALSRNNYFIEQRYDKEPVYQYHPLFREFLLSRVQSNYAPEILSGLSTRAAALLEESDQPEAAAALFRQRSDWWGLVGVIMRNARGLIDQGRFGLVEEWLAVLPAEIMESSPWLLFFAGACRVINNPKDSRSYFERSFARFQDQDDGMGLFLSSWGVVLSILVEMADFKPLNTWIPILENLEQRYPAFPSEEIELRFVEAVFSSLVYRNPGHPDIERWADRAFSLAGRTSNIHLKIQTMGFLAFFHDYTGEFEKALAAINLVKGLIRSRESTPSGQLIFLALESTHLLQCGYPEKCLTVVEEALELFQSAGIRMFKVSTLSNGIVAAFNLNDQTKVDQWIYEMEASLDHSRSWDLACYHSVKILQCKLRKDPISALAHAKQGTELISKNGISIVTGLCSIQYALVMHALGKDLEAIALAVDALRFGRKIKGMTNSNLAFLTMALIAFDRGQEARGKGCLRKAFDLGRKGGFYANWGIHPDDLARLCSKAIENGIEVEYAREYIRRYRLKPAPQPVQPEHWPWPLKVFHLGTVPHL